MTCPGTELDWTVKGKEEEVEDWIMASQLLGAAAGINHVLVGALL